MLWNFFTGTGNYYTYTFDIMQAFNNGILKAECLPYVRGVPYKGKVPKEEEFTPTQLATRLKEQFGKKLYAVIDLTYTSRYYSSKVYVREIADNLSKL